MKAGWVGQMAGDVLKWYTEHPDDWQTTCVQCWQPGAVSNSRFTKGQMNMSRRPAEGEASP
ncbi:MAG: hypothetical protein ACYTEL_08550 [Planctomycetota bacterium]|jgi:hypothetical protein